jgi:hypothetical protein
MSRKAGELPGGCGLDLLLGDLALQAQRAGRQALVACAQEKTRFLLLLAWLTRWPLRTPLPVNSQRRAMGDPS